MRKGFTLIELLIVMVVIAVLSGMMMLASSEIQATANVTQVLNDLAIVKQAFAMLCFDNFDEYETAPNCDPPTIQEIKKYINNESVIDSDGNNTSVTNAKWGIEVQNSGKPRKIWYLWYRMPQHMTDSYSFRKKLAAKARNLALFNSPEPDPDSVYSASDAATRFYNVSKGRSGGNPVTIYTPIVR